MDIQPIETVYSGYKFRSRLEARWAIFFDAVGLKYTYEAEGFELPDGTRYLPDFYIQSLDMYVEIKPDYSGDEPRRKLAQLTKSLLAQAILIEGAPSVSEHALHDVYQVEWVIKPREYNIAYFVGSTRNILHSWAEHYFTEAFYSLQEMLTDKGYKAPKYDGGVLAAYALIELDKKYFLEKHGKPHHKWKYGISYENLCFEDMHPYDQNWFTLGLTHSDIKADVQATSIESARLTAAMNKARQARFEHGEKG